MIKILEEITMLCDADKRKDANLDFVSVHVINDFYLRLDEKHKVGF